MTIIKSDSVLAICYQPMKKPDFIYYSDYYLLLNLDLIFFIFEYKV